MDVSLAIKQRLDELGLEQRELARAAQVTESYISQLLTRRRVPPAPNRTDIYDKMDKALKLPRGELARLAAHQRKEQLKRELGDLALPLFGEVRELLLRKCHPTRERAVRAIFEKQPFGEVERLITKTILDLVKRIAKTELTNESWLRTVAKLSGRSFQEMRVVALDFLDADILALSHENCVVFLEPLVKSWDIDLTTFELEVVLNPKVSPGSATRFQFMERPPADRATVEPGFAEFLADQALSGTATADEMKFLEGLRFTTGRPTALYYYRELQSLRDPLHVQPAEIGPLAKPPRRSRK
ncbi:MAG: helix-turn-helix transcriptional regulator [Gemmatimonadales bacterium]